MVLSEITTAYKIILGGMSNAERKYSSCHTDYPPYLQKWMWRVRSHNRRKVWNKFCLLKDESTKVPISSGGQPNVCDYSLLFHILVSGSKKIFSELFAYL